MSTGARRLIWIAVTLAWTAVAVLLMGVVAVLLFAVGILAVFSLFVGSDHLLASIRGRTEPAFDWFDGTPWSGRATSTKRVATRAAAILAAVFIVLAVLFAVLLVIGLLLGALGDLP